MKNFLLDTNVLLHDPNSIFEFEDNKVVVLLDVLEELDTFKNSPGEIGNNARRCIRLLDDLRHSGNLNDGVKLENGGILRVISHINDDSIDTKKIDNKILSTAKQLAQVEDSIVITKDINLRVKADALKIKAEDYEKDKVYDEAYKGYCDLFLDDDKMATLVKDGFLSIDEELEENEYVKIVNDNGEFQKILGRHRDGVITYIKGTARAISIKPRNIEQSFALDALLDDDIKLVTLQAKAGAGKTLLCIASALEKTLENGTYEKIVITRPVIPVGKDIGFLPGDLEEKMDPWIKPIFDNIDVLKNKKLNLDKIKNMLEIAPLTYIRGRSLANSFIIVDEAQNLSPLEIKTIVTRVGEGSKIVFTGDLSQIDKITLDKYSSGFAYLIKNFRNQGLYAHIELEKSERSQLAELAANIL